MGRVRFEGLGDLSVMVMLVVVAFPGTCALAQEGSEYCFANPRYGGPCAVAPAAGETCASILAYLNRPSGAGKSYCSSTDVRGGRTQIQCSADGATAGPRETLQARPTEMYSMPSRTPSFSPQAYPAPQPLVVTPGSVIQVSMDDTVDLGQAPPGTSFAAHLDADLVVDGAVDLTRATIKAQRQEIVAANLELSEGEAAAFWPLYREYRAAVDALGARDAKLITDYARTFESLTDAQARALLDEATAVEGERAKLKQQYVKRFAKVLLGAKLARFFQIENKLDAVIRMELAAGIPLAR